MSYYLTPIGVLKNGGMGQLTLRSKALMGIGAIMVVEKQGGSALAQPTPFFLQGGD